MLASARAPRGPSIGILHGLLSGASQVLDAAWRIIQNEKTMGIPGNITWMRSSGAFSDVFYLCFIDVSSMKHGHLIQRSWRIRRILSVWHEVWFYRRMVGKDMSVLGKLLLVTWDCLVSLGLPMGIYIHPCSWIDDHPQRSSMGLLRSWIYKSPEVPGGQPPGWIRWPAIFDTDAQGEILPTLSWCLSGA